MQKWDIQDETGQTPLMIAADKGFEKIAEVLINNGSDARKLLIEASQKGQEIIVNTLLKAGC